MPQPPVRRGTPRAPKPAVRSRPTPRGDAPWEDAVEAFLADKRRLGASAGTGENYRHHLLGPRITAYRRDQGVATVGAMTADRIGAFETELFDAGLKPGSVATYHRILRNFIRWCRVRGMAIDEEVAWMKGPRLAEVEPPTLSREQEATLVRGARSERDAFLVRFMCRTGLRLSEVAQVQLDDLVDSPDGWYVRVRQGKGRKDRLVPLDTRSERHFSRELAVYLRDVRVPRDRDGKRLPTSSRALFLTLQREEDGEVVGLSAQAIKTLFRRLREETGVDVHPHTCRHTAASRWIAAGIPASAVQRALGHTTMAMTARYVHFDPASLLTAFRA